MQFRYPARLQPDLSGEITVSFRDFPECLTSAVPTSQRPSWRPATRSRKRSLAALTMTSPSRCPVADAQASSTLPFHPTWLQRPRSPSRTGTAVCLALPLLDASASTRKSYVACLTPGHHTAANRIHKALRSLGRELIVEFHAAQSV